MDSCALALVARQALDCRPDQFPGGMIGYHARHALRGSESEGDAASVAELCGKLGLALVIVDAKIEPGSGLEARARLARYSRVRQAAGDSTLLLTAHHSNDQAETVLLRLLRGAGVVGLRGIHSLRFDGVWRPFLRAFRQDLARVCAQSHWAGREDSSNLDLTFERNFLRRQFLPLLESEHPNLSDALVKLAESAQQLEPFLERRLERLSNSLGLQFDPLGFSLDLSGADLDSSLSLDPELDLLLERAWTRCGRRPWAHAQRTRLLSDVASGSAGRRTGGQGEIAIWGGKTLRIERL